MIEITDLKIYPVKSLHGFSLPRAKLGIRGLAFDRNWMVIDSNFKFVTQRQIPKMATIKVSLNQKSLILEHDSISPLVVDLSKQRTNPLEVTIWQDRCKALNEGKETSKWLTEVLGNYQGKDLQLVRFANNYKRPVDANYLQGENSHTAFADGFPFLITAEESLESLNKQLGKNGAKPITMDRFRPNIVIRGAKAFEENSFTTLTETNNNFSLGIRKPCQRCKITTINQDTAESQEPKEPLKTLVQMNPFSNLKGAFFGQNATLLSGNDKNIAITDKLIFSKQQ